MARINIEDSLFLSDDFLSLTVRLRCQFKATGMLVSAFRLAQYWYLKTETNRLIPKEKLPDNLKLLVDLGFITLINNTDKDIIGYYVKGSEKQFSWLLQRSNAGKSMKPSRKKKISVSDVPLAPVSSRSLPLNGTKPLYSLLSSLRKESIYIPQFDILDLYKLYPRKLGKAKGLLALTHLIKTQQKYDDVKTAITNYSAFLKKEQVEPKFIKHFPTFINNYTDWLDQEAGSTDIQTVENSFETIDGVIL